jgi:hypothetical protein
LFDATGRLVKEIINVRQHAGKYQKTINMSNLAQGVYFINCLTVAQNNTLWKNSLILPKGLSTKYFVIIFDKNRSIDNYQDIFIIIVDVK